MGDKLTNEDKVFIKEVVEHGNQTEAARKAYKIKSDDYARKKGSVMVAKGSIKKAIQTLADRIPDDLLIQKHFELLNQKQVSYFVFPKKMPDDEIENKVNGAGFEVINIKDGEKGKYAFYSNNDANAIKAGLDMSYKLKGSYVVDENKNINVLMPVLVKFLNSKDDRSDNGNTE